MKKIFTLILTAFTTAAAAQINMADSSAQVVSYFNLGEKQSYSVSLQKIKITGTDTVSDELMTYDVDITIVDSTANSYVIEWFYHNYKTNSSNEVIRKVTTLSENLKVLIETNELGVVKGVKNWEEISKKITKIISQIKTENKDKPELIKIIEQIEAKYTSKSGVENGSIQDVQQFHSFHGGKYVLGQVIEFPLNVPNMYYPEKPFDSKVKVSLDEIYPTEDNFIIRSTQEIDAEQLTKTTLDYLKSISDKMGTTEIKREDIGLLTNVTQTSSRIHGTGWLIYSIQTKIVEAVGAKSIEERIIEIK